MTVIAFGRIPLTPDQCLVDGVDGGGSAPLTHRCFPSSYLKTSRYLVSSMSYLMYFFVFLHLFKVFFPLVHIHTLCNSNFFLYATSRTCSTSSDRHTCTFLFIPPVSERFFFFCRFKTKLGPFSKHPSIFSLEHHVGAEVAETGYFSCSTRKRFLFHVFHSSTFDDIYSSRGGETFFSFFPSYCWYCSIIVHIYILKYKDPFSERGTAAAHESTQLSSSRTILR